MAEYFHCVPQENITPLFVLTHSHNILTTWVAMFAMRRMWQNSKHSSRSAWVQILKDKMEPAVPASKSSEQEVDLDAETEVLGDQSDEGGSEFSDIPDDFMGIVDEPLYDGSEPPLSQPRPIMDDEVRGLVSQLLLYHSNG